MEEIEEEFDCEVCWETSEESFGLDCGHRLCLGCYQADAREKAHQHNEIPYCYEEDCKDRVIPPSKMKKLLSKNDFEKYEKLLT